MGGVERNCVSGVRGWDVGDICQVFSRHHPSVSQ